MSAYLKGVAWFYDEANRDAAIRIMATASNTRIADNAQSYDYYRKIGFFERTGTVSTAALKSLVTALKGMGEIKGDLPPEKLILPGVTKPAP